MDLQRALAAKERELQLVLALDHIRDSFDQEDDQQEMFNNIVTLLVDRFKADACAIALLAETSDDIESLSVSGFEPDEALVLCRRAMHHPEAAHIEVQTWANVLGIQVTLTGLPLAGLALARRSQPFDDEEIHLLRTAESQIDSAVVQAYTSWKLIQRNRELEAIYQIDRLRDQTTDESELISGFSTILLDRYRADMCAVFVSHVDSGDLVMRNVVDRRALAPGTLEALRLYAAQIHIPQVIPAPEQASELTFLAAPLIADSIRLGAVVVGRLKPFTVADHRLLYAMTSQFDTAIVHSRMVQQYNQRSKELEVVYNIDRIRDQELDFDSMLHRVLTELCRVITSELAFLILYDESGQQMEIQLTASEGIEITAEHQEVVRSTARDALSEARLVFFNEREGAVRSAIAVPLILNDRVIGVFGAINSSQTRGFNAEDRRILSAITSQIDTAVFERLERRRMRRLLSRSVDPKVLDYLLQQADVTLLAGDRREVSILFADLRRSTEWAEQTRPEELVSTLNTFLAHMTEIVFKHDGTLDKYVGDQVIALFGAPLPVKDHALFAAQAALEMQVVHRRLRGELALAGRELPLLGIGIASGEVIAGEMGAPIHTHFTAIGRVVNLGSRLCDAAEGGQILISQATRELLGGVAAVESLGDMTFKGFKHPRTVYRLITLNATEGMRRPGDDA